MTDAGGFGPQQKEGEPGRDFVSEVKGRIYGVHVMHGFQSVIVL